METMERKKPRPPPVFHAGVQGEIVERCRAGDRTAGQVARDFDLTETAVRAWVAGAETERREAAARSGTVGIFVGKDGDRRQLRSIPSP
jgi:transposase-like protein